MTISTQFPAIGDDSQTTMIGLDLRKASREKTLTVQRTKQNQSYDSGERSKKYHEEKQKKSQKLSNKTIPISFRQSKIFQVSNIVGGGTHYPMIIGGYIDFIYNQLYFLRLR